MLVLAPQAAQAACFLDGDVLLGQPLAFLPYTDPAGTTLIDPTGGPASHVFSTGSHHLTYINNSGLIGGADTLGVVSLDGSATGDVCYDGIGVVVQNTGADGNGLRLLNDGTGTINAFIRNTVGGFGTGIVTQAIDGKTTINVLGGTVTADNAHGIDSLSDAGDIEINLVAGGIGTALTPIGALDGLFSAGIIARTSAGGDIKIVIDPSFNIFSADEAINVSAYVDGNIDILTTGPLSGSLVADRGIAVLQRGVGDVNIGTATNRIGNIDAYSYGIAVDMCSCSDGDLSIFAGGTITLDALNGDAAITAVYGSDGKVTVDSTAAILNGLYGISVASLGGGDTEISNGGTISVDDVGVYVQSTTGGSVTVKGGGSVDAAVGIQVEKFGPGNLTIGTEAAPIGNITSSFAGISGVALLSDGDNAIRTAGNIAFGDAAISLVQVSDTGNTTIITAPGTTFSSMTGVYGIFASRAAFVSGTGNLLVDNGANIRMTDDGLNTGIIASLCNCTAGSLTVLNRGDITAAVGIDAYGSVAVVVRHLAGAIHSSDTGILVGSDFDPSDPAPLLTVEVAAGAQVIADTGIFLDPNFTGDFSPTDVTIAGRVDGTGGTAIALGDNADLVTLHPTRSIAGEVLAEGGIDTLALGGPGTGSFDLGALGGQFKSFEILSKTGSSTWSVTGAATLLNPVGIAAGRLNVEGALTASVTVAAGATLGGSGTVNGNITVNGGLSPGSSPGTLTVNGNLVLNGTSASSFELNRPGGTPNPLNDLVNVRDNLTLGGTLAITTQAAGYYRLFNYGGTLSGSFAADPTVTGLASATATVLTNVNHQVNVLINGVGQAIQFWDGADFAGNGVVDGGTQNWTTAGNNWTALPGALFNDRWRNSVGVFAGTAGVVTVVVTQRLDTLQFSTDGYRLTGGTLAFATGTGTFVADAGVTATIESAISGTGNLFKAGDGVLRLAGSTSYTGTTTIAAGTLKLGGDGVLPDGTALGIGSTGTFDLAGFDQTVAALSGAGKVTLGAGRLTLAGTAADVSYSGVISGSGGLTKLGTNTLNLTGASTYTGSTLLDAGRLVVNGSIAGSVVSIASGATLGGSGTVGGIIAKGTVAPGNSIGTLNVDGNVAFNVGSTYEVEINAGGKSDLIAATGRATLTGGNVSVLAAAGTYTVPISYTILTASGGVTGKFAGYADNLALLDGVLKYDANRVLVVFERNSTDVAALGLTPNQIATGEAIDAMGLDAPYLTNILTLTKTQVPAMLDALSGEVHASIKGVLIDDSRYVRDAALDRVAQAFAALEAAAPAGSAEGGATALAADLEPGLWARAYGGTGTIFTDGNAAAVGHSTGGVVMGTDGLLGDWRLGLLVNFGTSHLSIPDRRSTADATSFGVGAYGGTEWNDIAIRFGAAYAHHSVSTTRTAAFPGVLDTFEASYGASTGQVFGEISRDFDIEGVTVTPFGGLAYVSVANDAFTETGAGAGALSVKATSTDALFTTLGLRAATAFELGNDMRVTLSASAGWRHAFAELPTSTNSFAGGPDFLILGAPLSSDSIVLEAGIGIDLSESAKLSFAYSGQLDGSRSSQAGTLTFTLKF